VTSKPFDRHEFFHFARLGDAKSAFWQLMEGTVIGLDVRKVRALFMRRLSSSVDVRCVLEVHGGAELSRLGGREHLRIACS
jgi:hypothetical protein